MPCEINGSPSNQMPLAGHLTSKTVPDESNITSPTAINSVTPLQCADIDPVAPIRQESPTRCSTAQALLETRAHHASEALSSFFGKSEPTLLFYGAEKVVRMSPDTVGSYDNWFVLGDIHGDYYALRNSVEYISAICPDFGLIFLGDLIDRGPHQIECLWYILHLAKEYPNKILWIAGNHDVGISYNTAKNCFISSVSPSDFQENLNEVDAFFPFRRFLGREFVELVNGLPRAVLFPDGSLFTHGGFPHYDLQRNLSGCVGIEQQIAWLNSPECLQDFTWTRITGYPTKIPNRSATGCSYGYRDFGAFCHATGDFFPTKRLVTGHDHPEGGFDLHPEWKDHLALTLTGCAFHADYDDPQAFNERYRDHLIIARCRENNIPEIIKIPVDRSDLADFIRA